MFKFKIRNVAKLLLGTGAIMVSLHTAVVTFGSCAEKSQCLANVYFGIPGNSGIPVLTDLNMVSGTTETMVIAGSNYSLADMYTVLQVTGLYLIMIGIVAFIIFELNKLPLLHPRRLVRKS